MTSRETKKCRGCQETLSTTKFYRRGIGAGKGKGLEPYCKRCSKQRGQKKRERYREKWRTQDPHLVGGTKYCSRCKKHLPTTAFSRSICHASGLQGYCKQCSRPKNVIVSVERKTCSKCHEERPSEDFGMSALSSDGLDYRCRKCHAADATKLRDRNRKRWEEESPYDGGPPKKCSKCKRTKPKTEFSRSRGAYDGLQGTCKKCQMKNWRILKYGRTLAEGSASCEICGAESQCIDHCHKTGKTRGNLCEKCNWGLGHFRDDPDLLVSARKYLKRWSKR